MRAGQMPGIGVSLEFTLVEVEEDFAAFAGAPGPHAYNPIGSVHGGYAAAWLASACGCTVHSKLRAGQRYTTREPKPA